MNIFLPYKSFEKCARTLDDKRLIKQILECKQILMMIMKKKEDDSYKSPYLNHPVVVNYFDQEHHIVEYAMAMCKEYSYRFRKIHGCHYWFVHRMTICVNDFSPIFVAGSKNSKDCIREKDVEKVQELFRQSLLNKWSKDKSPKWTNRNKPNFKEAL